MENFQQELSSAGQSSTKEAWLLVCSCVRSFSQQLEKVRSPASASSDDPSALAGANLWAMVQTHRVLQEFMASQLRSHSSIAGIINYHVFKIMVPLSAHSALKEEIVVLKNKDKERYTEWSNLTTRLVKLEAKK